MDGFGTSRRRTGLDPTSGIACRICDQVFMSTQAFIDHVEAHMFEDEAYSRRQGGGEINLRPPSFRFPAPAPTPFCPPPFGQSEGNIFRRLEVVGPQLPRGCTDMSQLPQFMQSHAVEPLADRNLPTNLPDAVRIQVGRANQDDDNNNISDDTETLDLTLKL